MSAVAPSTEPDRDALKRAAAEAAVELVEDGMVVGLGTGSTAAFALDALGRRHQQGLHFLGIPTSEATAARARAAGIPLTSFAEHRQIDLTIDGADEVQRGTLNLIKGRGGALLHGKIVAAASRRLAIVVDGTKLVIGSARAPPFPWRSSPSGWMQPACRSRCSAPAFASGARRRASPSSPIAVTRSSIAASVRSPTRRDCQAAAAAPP
jgi:ribose 5-phosphate isomerase A